MRDKLINAIKLYVNAFDTSDYFEDIDVTCDNNKDIYLFFYVKNKYGKRPTGSITHHIYEMAMRISLKVDEMFHEDVNMKVVYSKKYVKMSTRL
jgi:hypothetical protein